MTSGVENTPTSRKRATGSTRLMIALGAMVVPARKAATSDAMWCSTADFHTGESASCPRTSAAGELFPQASEDSACATTRFESMSTSAEPNEANKEDTRAPSNAWRVKVPVLEAACSVCAT